jgi:hypothetical protein
MVDSFEIDDEASVLSSAERPNQGECVTEPDYTGKPPDPDPILVSMIGFHWPP